MDTASFDRLARHIGAHCQRRSLLRSFTVLPLGLAIASAALPSQARKRKKKCKKKSKVCKGKCGKVTYKCRKRKKTANCGSCCDVCPSGCPFASVQAAINAAKPGATIRICCGTYTESLQITKNLTLAGNCSPSRPALQGTGAARVLTVSGGTVSLQGLLITGGRGGIANSATLTMTGCLVSGNHALGEGGGIDNVAMLTLRDCEISGNTASTSGGGIANNGGTVALEDGTTVIGNQAISGGGIYNNGPINTGGPGTSTCSGGSSVSGNIPTNCVAFGGGSCGSC